jgi:hypothetical protein
MKQLHAFDLGHAGRPQIRYRARAFDSDHPFKAGRSAIRVRAKNGCLVASNLSMPSRQSSVRASEIRGIFKVRRLFSLLSDICARVMTGTSAGSAEYFRQFLDPVVSPSGIEIEGLGRRLIRDAHAEPDTIDVFPLLADFNFTAAAQKTAAVIAGKCSRSRSDS